MRVTDIGRRFRRHLKQKLKHRRKLSNVADRERIFRSDLWQKHPGIAQRSYATYDDYIKHQAAKLQTVENTLRRDEPRNFDEFVRSLEGCEALQNVRSAICLAARLGEEVRAFHSLGIFAVGIDLNPGSNNSYVLPGDFHALVFPDGSIEAAYTNSLDHVFDLGRFLAEVTRVLRPGGVFVTDVVAGYEEGFLPGSFEAMHWPTVAAIAAEIAAVSGMPLENTRPLGLVRRNSYTQLVFRNQPAARLSAMSS